MRALSGIHCFAVVTLLVIQGCSTTASTGTVRPVIEKSSPAPVARDRPAPVVPSESKKRAPVQSTQPPAVIALLAMAEQQANAGDLESSAASLERAIRISPRNPVLWYHLATLRLAQGDARQAEQLAVKSNSLAPGNTLQQARNWSLIARSRRERGDSKGAALAEQRARDLEQR